MVLVRPESSDPNIHNGQQAAVKVKTPKRVLHFCDGVLEEYSSDEEVEVPKQEIVNPATLTWAPWFWYKAWAAGASTVAVVDAIGEYLASFFGITTPRYYFELEEYKKREKEKQQGEDAERGWSQPSGSTVSMPLKDITSQPKPVEV
ncbi:hypothetical protein NQ317_013817 [Molorchus minor]|uniref:Protein FAM177A1 n=1 Tax=Molorchus minor TaxID=1323400 RepID=A0ABQ9JTX9_9CUCU|nr:hypothetical protein NQ317_013817 [Molorchus minor]